MSQVNGAAQQRPVVPKEFGGKWMAWNHAATRIIASGDDLQSVAKAAKDAGEAHPSFEKVPRSDVGIIGAAR